MNHGPALSLFRGATSAAAMALLGGLAYAGWRGWRGLARFCLRQVGFLHDDQQRYMARDGWNLPQLNALTSARRFPLVVVDLDIFDENVRKFAEIARSHGKKVRLATKSIRVPKLIRRIVDLSEGSVSGLMCYSTAEALHLAVDHGLDDIMLGYPVCHEDLNDYWNLVVKHGKTADLQVDCIEHIDMIEDFWRDRINETEEKQLFPNARVCVDVDCSYSFFGKRLGAKRSPLHSFQQAVSLIQRISESRYVTLVGIMCYETISSVQDSNPYDSFLYRILLRFVQTISRWDMRARRTQLASYLAENNIKLEYFNAGSSGSFRRTAAETVVTEVTAGSGFLQSHLFDYFRVNQNRCAFVFGLRITRIPCRGVVTCQSGGFTSSGKSALDKSPVPFLPVGLQTVNDEGFGEVQTPFVLPDGLQLRIGDAVYCRPAKAGELAERFSEYLLKQGDAIQDVAKTYRGEGFAFF